MTSTPHGTDSPRPDSAEGAALILPHRARAILQFALIGLAGRAACLLAWYLAETALAGLGIAEIISYVWPVAFVVFVALSVFAWLMASRDLRAMAAGRMDPAGRWLTRLGKAVVLLEALAWIVLASATAVRVIGDMWREMLPG